MNRTNPVGAIAPGAFVRVALSVTDEPGTTSLAFVLDNVANPGVALLMMIWAIPPAAPLRLDIWPTSVPRATGCVSPGVSAGVGILKTRSCKLTWHVLAARGPVAGPRMMSPWGTRLNSPLRLPPGGGPMSNPIPAQGAVLASPTAVNTLKVSCAAGSRHGTVVPCTHAGVKSSTVSFTDSVSLVGVDSFFMVMVVEMRFPTVASLGHVGTALPPIPASAGVAPRRHAAKSAITTPSPIPSRFTTQTLRIVLPPPPRAAGPNSHDCLKGNFTLVTG